MAEARYTEGPWRWVVDPDGKYGIYPQDGIFLAIVDSKANARLIAASPDLLEAAKLALEFLKANGISHGKALADAIAKATGNYKGQ